MLPLDARSFNEENLTRNKGIKSNLKGLFHITGLSIVFDHENDQLVLLWKSLRANYLNLKIGVDICSFFSRLNDLFLLEEMK